MMLRNHLIDVLEEADVEENPELRRKLLTFVVGGGGFSGVEMMAELNDFVHALKKNIAVCANSRIAASWCSPAAAFWRKCRKSWLSWRRPSCSSAASKSFSTINCSPTSERAILQSGIEIACKTLISTVPFVIPAVIQKLDCPKERDRLLVNTGVELKGYEGQVWALGDCAFSETLLGTKVPPTTQHAFRQATTAAINIAAAVRGRNRSEFAFEGPLTLGSLGHGRGAADSRRQDLRSAGLLPVALHLLDEDAGRESQGSDRHRLASALAVSHRGG
jgi:NADH dehydrogenase